MKADIAEVIRENGRQEITGDILQQVLLGMVGELGGGATFAGIAEPHQVCGIKYIIPKS